MRLTLTEMAAANLVSPSGVVGDLIMQVLTRLRVPGSITTILPQDIHH